MRHPAAGPSSHNEVKRPAGLDSKFQRFSIWADVADCTRKSSFPVVAFVCKFRAKSVFFLNFVCFIRNGRKMGALWAQFGRIIEISRLSA